MYPLRPSLVVRRRPRPIVRRLYGWYVHRQWGKDTELYRNVRTDVQVSVSTVIMRDFRALALYAYERLSLSCIFEAFQSAGFPYNQLVALMSGLDELGAAEIRRLPRRVLREMLSLGDVVEFPLAKAVMRIYHLRGNARIRGPYEYWVVFSVYDCSDVRDKDVGAGRPGRRPKGQTTLEEVV